MVLEVRSAHLQRVLPFFLALFSSRVLFVIMLKAHGGLTELLHAEAQANATTTFYRCKNVSTKI